jgi:hypothetical protein
MKLEPRHCALQKLDRVGYARQFLTTNISNSSRMRS